MLKNAHPLNILNIIMESTSVILTFHTIQGMPNESKTIHYAPFHHLGPFEAATIRSVEVGEKVALYGSVMKQVNGVHVPDYIHLRSGKYTFHQPFQWLTMHADEI
jgi:hypothetical protein